MPPLDTRVAERRLELDRSLLNVIPQAVQGLAGSIERYGQTLHQSRVFQQQVKRDKENAAIKKAENNAQAFSYMAGYNDQPMAFDPAGNPMFDVQTYDMGQRRRRLELGEKVEAENRKAELLQKQADRDAKDAEEGAKMLRKFEEMRALGTSLGLPEGAVHPADTEDSVRAKVDRAMEQEITSVIGNVPIEEITPEQRKGLSSRAQRWIVDTQIKLHQMKGVEDRAEQTGFYRDAQLALSKERVEMAKDYYALALETRDETKRQHLFDRAKFAITESQKGYQTMRGFDREEWKIREPSMAALEADIQKAARQYLVPTQRTVLVVEPPQETGRAGAPR